MLRWVWLFNGENDHQPMDLQMPYFLTNPDAMENATLVHVLPFSLVVFTLP